MSGLSPRFRAFPLLVVTLAGLGLSIAPAAGHRIEVGPRAGGPLAADELDRSHFIVDAASRSTGPVQLTWPADGLKTGWFGEVRAGHLHPGMDIDGETGDPVTAAGPGTVAFAGPAPVGYSGYGTIVDIDHGQGIHTLYAHLSRIDVVTGQVVAAGRLLGAIGTSGNVTGSHLHFEVRVGGNPVDPEDWLPPRPAVPATQPAGGGSGHPSRFF
jgi:murein DD-endopeptidase MepM/ murein hydrolase activator NlpD